ncbi:MAG TPA: NADH-quinone oxidoreductase subunit M [Actinomycetes bacterium]|nr:NADH-quinone oxidoreductase subunit M [Actinomycetes bacterium]
MTDLLLPLLLALPAAGALGLLVAPPRRAERLAVRFGLAVTTATFAVAGWAVAADAATDVEWVPTLGLRLHLGVDGVSSPLLLLTCGLTALCTAYLLRVRPEAGRLRALVGLILLLEVGMVGTFVALDLLLFFVFFEVVLVPMWFVIAQWGDDSVPGDRRRAANLFILYTLLGSVVMLVGILLVGSQAGTFDMVELADRQGADMSRGIQVLAFLALGLGFAVKTPMWPLHTWLPDAHTAAPTVGSVLLAGVLLKMGTYGFVRVALPVAPEGAEVVAPFLGALAVVGIVYGSLACLAQTDLKRLIAFSSVSHMGFVLLGISTLTPVGVNGALYANIAHGLITGLLFFLVGAIKDRHHTASIAVLGGGLYERMPRLGGLLAFAAVASLGLPGLAGFWGEMLVLLGAFDPATELNRPYYLVLMALAGLGVVLTTTYFASMLRRVAQGTSYQAWRDAVLMRDASRFELLVWAPVVALVLVLGLWPGWLLDASDPVVQTLLSAQRVIVG